MARANINSLHSITRTPGVHQWFSLNKYGYLMGQNLLMNNALKSYFRSKKNILFSNAIVQHTFIATCIYIPIYIMEDIYSIHYFYKNLRNPFFFRKRFFLKFKIKYLTTKFFSLKLSKLYLNKKERLSFLKLNTFKDYIYYKAFFKYKPKLTLLALKKIRFQTLYHLMRSLLKTSIKMDIILVNRIDHYPGLFTQFIAHHLNRRRDFKTFKYKIIKLLENENEHTSRIKGIYVVCTGRLSVRKILRKQKQWLIFNKVPINTYEENIFYCQTSTITKFGTYGIKIWFNYRKLK